jgi:hypothetical protein
LTAPATSDGQPRQIAVIQSYDDLHRALRERAAELQTTRLALDHLSGLQTGYVSKLLAPSPIRRLGPESMGPLMVVLGVRMIMVEDVEAMARIVPRLEQRKLHHASGGMPTRGRSANRGDSAWGKRMAALRQLNLSKHKRRAIARRAAKIRWARNKAGAAKKLTDG